MFRQDLIIENIDLPDIVDIGTYTKVTEVTLSAFVYGLFHKGFSLIIGTNLVLGI